MKKKLYIAYGSNLNLQQMAYRCPKAKPLGTAVIKDWMLTFRGWKGHGVLNIEPQAGKEVPVGIWEITPECEQALDRYEGYPRLYVKKDFMVKINGRGHARKAMAYIMVDGYEMHKPSAPYWQTCMTGYSDFNLEATPLYEAAKLAIK